MPSFDDDSAQERWIWLRFFVGLLALAVLVFGRNLGDTFLSDDYLYVDKWRDGLGALLRSVTVASYPQMIRPWPALFWMLSSLTAGHVMLHVLSLLLHAANGSLLALLIWRRCKLRVPSFLVGALFVVFPLFGEPVLWLSASFDLWACFFALLALVCIEGRAGGLASAGFYAAGLLSKEGIFTLPLLAPFATAGRRTRWTTAAMATVAAGYLLVRWWLFHGIGGYVQAEGHQTVLHVTPQVVLQTLAIHLPYALLVPFKGVHAARWLCAAVTVFLGIGVFASVRASLRPLMIVRSLTVALLALLPVVPVLGLAIDFAGGRFFYFPVAMLILSAGPAMGRLSRLGLWCVGVLLLYWSAASYWNAHSWTRASDDVKAILSIMQTEEHRFPPGAVVLVDAPDMRDGAYVFRVGLAEAARWCGLRSDVAWLRGTTGALDSGGLRGLGKNVFEIGIDAHSRGVDWTRCSESLARSWLTSASSAEERTRFPHGPLTPASDRQLLAAFDAKGVGGLAITLGPSNCRTGAPVEGLVFWRTPGSPFFTMTDSQPMRFAFPDCESLVRLPARARGDRVELRIDLALPLPHTGEPMLMLVPQPADGACP
jgi:hypothetical protein